MTIDLKTATPEQISAAVAECVAGWTEIRFGMGGLVLGTLPGLDKRERVPSYTTSADAVLPLLRKAGYVDANLNPYTGVWLVSILNGQTYLGQAATFPLAACIALLRTHGIEVK
jgi:hypothetical protein